MTKKQKAKTAVERLKIRYPKAQCSLVASAPHELLIATRLSAQCTDKRVNMVTPALFEKYKSITDFANANAKDVGEIIKSCGLYKTKANDIVNMCIMLRDEYNCTVPNSIEELTRLPGVGRKTANLIMGDVFNQPAIVTDTHLIRISNRLGLVNTKEPKKVEFSLRDIIDPEESSDFCHRIVNFGRDICKAQNPLCHDCELSDVCKNAKSSK